MASPTISTRVLLNPGIFRLIAHLDELPAIISQALTPLLLRVAARFWQARVILDIAVEFSVSSLNRQSGVQPTKTGKLRRFLAPQVLDNLVGFLHSLADYPIALPASTPNRQQYRSDWLSFGQQSSPHCRSEHLPLFSCTAS